MERHPGSSIPTEGSGEVEIPEWKRELQRRDPNYDFEKYPELGLAPVLEDDLEEVMRQEAMKYHGHEVVDSGDTKNQAGT